MGLFGIKTKRLLKDVDLVKVEHSLARWKEHGFRTYRLDDLNYELKQRALASIIFRSWPGGINYKHPSKKGPHAGKQRLPNCNHFAIISWAAVIMDGIKRDLDFGYSYGICLYTPKRGGFHMANAANIKGEPRIVEPQAMSRGEVLFKKIINEVKDPDLVVM